MSQSDYIQQKKNITLLSNSKSLADVLTNKEYTEFKKYSISNTVQNTLPTFTQLLEPTKIRVFDSEYKKTCIKTNFCVTKQAYYERRQLTNLLPTGYKQQIAKDDYFLTNKKKNILPCDTFYDCEKIYFLKDQKLKTEENDETYFFIG